MALHRLLLCLTLLGALSACQKTQWFVYIATDARVPQFGDRLLVEILQEDGTLACSGCQRQISAGTKDRWPISFGVDPDLGSGSSLHVRAQLYRSDHVDEKGLPVPAAYLDRVGRLPELDGFTQVGLVLGMACFGVPSRGTGSQTETCHPETGLLQPEEDLPRITSEAELPGLDSWLPGQLGSCSEVPADMKCIPGGSFVMGNPNDFGGTTPRDGNQVVESTSAQPEHLVALRSFAMDTDEMSAQNYYALRQLHPELPLPGTQGLDSSANQSPFCHYYGSDIDATSEWPLNCVSWQLAGQICAAQGKRLPTEAEWEYVAGNGIEETRFAWGNDENICAHSIVGRGWLQNEPNGTYTGPAFGDSRCRLSSANKLLPWGPQPGGHPQDVGSFGVRNLSGNMKEWLEDRFGAYEGPCWRGTVPGRNWLDNPVCRSAETGASDTFSARGGWWAELALSASVSQRDAWRGLSGGYIYGHMTVRCAKDL